MSGFINPSYAVVNETLGIDNIRDRKYRDLNAMMMTLRLEMCCQQKEAMFDLMKTYEADFQCKRI